MTSTLPDDRVAELAGELRTVIHRLAFHLRMPAIQHGVTPTRLTVMAALDKAGPQRPGDLAARLGISPASMSRLADVMETEQWVRRSPDPADRRAYQLSLTDHGVSVLDGLRRESTSRLADDLAALSAPHRTALVNALPVLVALADRHLEPDQPNQPAQPDPAVPASR